MPTQNLTSRVSGFTLVELVTGIVILGILAAVVIPRWFSRIQFEERGYFDQLLQASRYAQKLAIASGCEVRITINASDFNLRQPANTGECGSGTFTWSTVISLPADEPPYTAPSGVSVTAGTGNIIFSAAGQASVTQTVTVNGLHSFTVHAATGYVERL